jgi:hypothetical protein
VGVTRIGLLRTIARPNREVCDLLHGPIMLQCMSPQLAHIGRAYRPSSCPLSEVKLPRGCVVGEAAHDPKRTLSLTVVRSLQGQAGGQIS